MRKNLYVINSRGEREKFSFKKVYRSARRSGASKKVAFEIARSIEKELYPGISTREIFQKVKKILRSTSPQLALRFNLKEAIRKLGPTGFPFEKFIGEMLANWGFEVKINQYLQGRCGVCYEIDFIAQKEKVIYIGECKYHREWGARVDLQVALANYARFLDISQSLEFQQLKNEGVRVEAMLVTNTKFTSEAMRYANCVGCRLLGWKYPREQSLEKMIEKKHLYPITILPSLRGYLKEIFVQKKIMLVKDITGKDVSSLAKYLKVSPELILPLQKEAEILLEEKFLN